MSPLALRWRCRRGLLELDLALGGFLDTDYESLSSADRSVFQDLLAESDADIWSWIQGHESPARYASVLRYFILNISST
ncbi:MAG: FAD assembly factor SdhE [Acidiferrobacter sp.]